MACFRNPGCKCIIANAISAYLMSENYFPCWIDSMSQMQLTALNLYWTQDICVKIHPLQTHYQMHTEMMAIEASRVEKANVTMQSTQDVCK